MVTRKIFIASFALAAALALVGNADAQGWPSRPITMIVPFPAGGPTDTIGRVVADGMRNSLGQPIVIENVSGAAGSLGTGRIARTEPDGYTLFLGNSVTHVINGAVYALKYDLLKDFAPVILLAYQPQIIVAKKDFPARDLKELIAWLKANPGKASAGIGGIGGVSHVAGVFFEKETGTQFQFVPYRGLGPAMQDLVAGQIDIMIDQAANTLPQVRAGTIKAYAVTSKTRLPAAPDIPTVDEAGLPGFYRSSWHGLWVPQSTPESIVAKLNSAVVAAFADPTTRQRLADIGQETFPLDQQSPAALGALQRADIERWWPVIKAAGLRAQ